MQGIGRNGSGKQQAAARRMNTNKGNNGLLPFLFQIPPSSWLPTHSKRIHFTDTYTIYPHVHHIHPTSIMPNVYFVQLNHHTTPQANLVLFVDFC